MALQQIAQIEAQQTERDKARMRKEFGMHEVCNPLLSLPVDLYQ